MKIEFTTKEKSNRRREEAFLSLSGGERIVEFMKFSLQINNQFPSSKNIDRFKGNFVIEKKNDRLESKNS